MNSNLSAILSLHAELSLVLILLVALLADLFMGRHRQRWFHPVICVLMALQIGLNLTPDTRALFGGMYVNNFNRFGRMYQTYIQAVHVHRQVHPFGRHVACLPPKRRMAGAERHAL